MSPGKAVHPGPFRVLPLSASSQADLARLAQRCADELATAPDVPFAEQARSLQSRDGAGPIRAAVVATGREQAVKRLGRLADDLAAAPTWPAAQRPAPRIMFLFSGQGAQHPRMGLDLAEASPLFREHLAAAAALVDPYLEQPILEVIAGSPGDDGLLDRTVYTQPALFVFQYAMYRLWIACGVVPDVVMGHSFGEIVAACAAGRMTPAEAGRLVSTRGKLVETLSADGAMVAVKASEATVLRFLAERGSTLAIAAVNAGDMVTLSGARPALDLAVGELEAMGIEVRLLAVSHASHSPMMAPILDDLERAAAEIAPRPGQVPLISNVTGGLVADDVLLDAGYWRRHARLPVRFADGLAAAVASGVGVLLELGPHPVLLGIAARTVAPQRAGLVASARKGAGGAASLSRAMADLYVHGVPIDWERIHPTFEERA